MQQMICINEPLDYPIDKHWEPGDTFECEDQDVDTLKALGRAKLPTPQDAETENIAPTETAAGHSSRRAKRAAVPA